MATGTPKPSSPATVNEILAEGAVRHAVYLERYKTYEVSTVQEFVRALGPDRVIRLKPGTYQLAQVTGDLEQVDWRVVSSKDSIKTLKVGYSDYYGLGVFNADNLTIIGSYMRNTHIITSTLEVAVINFNKCDNLKLKNITFGHQPPGEYCAGSVIGTYFCNIIRIKNIRRFIYNHLQLFQINRIRKMFVYFKTSIISNTKIKCARFYCMG